MASPSHCASWEDNAPAGRPVEGIDTEHMVRDSIILLVHGTCPRHRCRRWDLGWTWHLVAMYGVASSARSGIRGRDPGLSRSGDCASRLHIAHIPPARSCGIRATRDLHSSSAEARAQRSGLARMLMNAVPLIIADSAAHELTRAAISCLVVAQVSLELPSCAI